MEQLELLERPYRYAFDACSFNTQKMSRYHSGKVFVSLWDKIADLVFRQEIITSTEIIEELGDEEIRKWVMQNKCCALEPDETIQRMVTEILKLYPAMIDFKKGKSSSDPFLIATAKKYKLTVITEEKSTSPRKIPMVCAALNIECLDITGLCLREGWTF